MRRRRKRANRWAVLLLALTLAAGIALFTAHLHRIFLEYAINECEDNALMEIGSLMEDEVYAHPERYASLVQLDYDSERHVAALRRCRRLLQRLPAAAGEQRKELLCLRGVKDPLRLFFCIFLLHK